MFIPYQFTSLVIGQHLNAREAFEILFPPIEAAGLVQECEALIDFLMVAGTVPGGTS